jgi:inosose dehydratase
VSEPYLSRRTLLRSAALGAASVVLGGRQEQAGAAHAASPYGRFKMGLQSYTLRAFPLDDALAKTKALGLSYWEAFPDHLPITDDPPRLAEYRSKLKDAGVQLLAYGVVGFGSDRAANRRVFEFARAMGIRTLSADPAPDSFASLTELVTEFRINIAIHNHGPGSRYSMIQDVATAIRDRDPRIGACVDTGHYLRSGEDPVDAVRRFGRRTYGLHLKDVKGGRQFTELGKGDLQLTRLLETLDDLGYQSVLSLEYEEHEREVIPYVEECLATTRVAVKQLAGRRAQRRRDIPDLKGY